MKDKSIRALPVFALALAGGCASQTSPQVVSGRVDATTFPATVTTAQVLRAGQVVAEAPVAADGSFSLTIPAGANYHIAFASATGKPGLVFPRSVGTIDVSFAVRGGGAPFDLGMVRYVGDPTGHTYVYNAAPADGDDIECEDGIDPNTGAVCVDDDDEGAGSCEGDGDDSNCEDGIDPATGAECDGGPSANTDGGAEEADGETEDDAVPGEAAVADHNLPASVGCGEDDEESDD